MLVHADPLRAFVAAVFRAAGCSGGESARIASYLVESNLAGHDSHGVIRVARYVSFLKEGKVLADRTISIVAESDALAVVDGGRGFGQTVAPQAVRLGVGKASKHGIAVVALRNSGHLGRIGDWAEMAADAGQVSLHFVNVAGSLWVAPFGGVERRMGTCPIAIGVPRTEAPPILLDFATAFVAEGKVLVALSGGKPLPAGCLIDADGTLSNDPKVLYGTAELARATDYAQGTGALRAIGEHKGSGLALMCELLAGALGGNGCTAPGRPSKSSGMLSIYLTAAAFDADGFFAREIDRYVGFFKSARPAGPGGEVLVPGEPERRMRAKRLAEGIPLADDAWRAIADTARGVGLGEREIAAAAA
jgi:uncharacterized oxidoreductase